MLASLAAAAGGQTPADPPAEWRTIQQLTSTVDNSNLPTIGNGLAVNGAYVHIVYSAKVGTLWKLHYLRSTNRGASWATPVVLEDSVEAFTFSIAADSFGNVHLISRRPVGRLCYRKSQDNGGSWLPSRELGIADMPVLQTDRQHHVYVIDPAASSQDASLYIRRSTDNGTTWQSPVFVTSQGGFGGLCASATRSGRVHVAWSYGQSGDSHIYHVASADRGLTWGSVGRVTTTPRATSYGIWAGAADEVLLSLTRYQATQNFTRSTNAGSTWSPEVTLPVLLADCAVDSLGGTHALGAKDYLHVMYLRTTDRGVTWSDTLDISGPGDFTRTRLLIEVGDRANLYAVWNSRETGTVQVFFRRGEGVGGVEEGASVPPERAALLLPNPAGRYVRLAGTAPAVIRDATGTVVAVLRPGANDISCLPDGVYFAGCIGPHRSARLIKLAR